MRFLFVLEAWNSITIRSRRIILQMNSQGLNGKCCEVYIGAFLYSDVSELQLWLDSHTGSFVALSGAYRIYNSCFVPLLPSLPSLSYLYGTGYFFVSYIWHGVLISSDLYFFPF
ncbi:hypothetical protein MKW98_012179 [Papaver atlanticum]|uniref:Uncharacterized protein n=1 Tax=Papaver atlanticum TaxID=357466 RepID=A0AAD4XLY6_9MAGN|nr:hypothetical protein MKW98_012179 [Papaver atlanticum]